MTYRELVYMVLDEIKQIADDSFITEDHVIFLANYYRQFLLEQKRSKDASFIYSNDNYQVLCLDLEQVEAIPDMDYCNDTYLRTIQRIPDTINGSTLKAYPYDYFYAKNIAIVSRDRFKFVGYNKYMANIIYGTLGIDGHLYLKSINPQFLYMKKLRVAGVFNDATEAAKYVCDPEGNACDILDQKFPFEGSLVTSLIEFLVKELTGVVWRQQDKTNDSTDSIDDIMNYLKQNVKSDLLKQLEQ